MSWFVNTISKSTLKNGWSLGQSLFRSKNFLPVRYLFTIEALGMDQYALQRNRTSKLIHGETSRFRQKMQAIIDQGKLFSEDLKIMTHMATDEDVDLVMKMIKKYNSQPELKFVNFSFGPVVMRMFHYLDLPQQALQCYEEPANKTFFEQRTSQLILCDLLFKHGLYDDLLRVFENATQKQETKSYPRHLVLLAMAAYYKQNTEQSLKNAARLLEEIKDTKYGQLQRTTLLFAALAWKQSSPDITLEVLAGLSGHYYIVKNLKALALADLGRVSDALDVFTAAVQQYTDDQTHKSIFFNETVQHVKAAVKKSGDEEMARQMENIEDALRTRKLVHDNETLEDDLTKNHMITKRSYQPEVTQARSKTKSTRQYS